jgi:hypothetical protein
MTKNNLEFLHATDGTAVASDTIESLSRACWIKQFSLKSAAFK